MKTYGKPEMLWLPMTEQDLITTSLTVSSADYTFASGEDAWVWL